LLHETGDAIASVMTTLGSARVMMLSTRNWPGMTVYPGLIDAGTVLGLIEIGRVRETHDYAEAGQFQPDLRAGVGVNPDSELIPVTRAGGITTTLVRPTGGIICGQASLIKLEDVIRENPAAWYQAYLAGEPLIKDLDENPFAATSIQKTVGGTLTALAAALR
jgi:imidazolonepropionase-like amidohydrolase